MKGVGQAGTVRRTTPVPPPPAWATADRPVTALDRESADDLPDLHLRSLLEARGMSPFMVRITVEDRHTEGGMWRIVQEMRR